MPKTSQETIIVLDFGGQHSHLPARQVRMAHVYCEILPYHSGPQAIMAKNPCGLILSGGDSSLPEDFVRRGQAEIFALGLPILAIIACGPL